MCSKWHVKKHAYTEEFRREVAEVLGVCPQQIYNWPRQFYRLADKQFNSVNGVDNS